METEKR